MAHEGNEKKAYGRFQYSEDIYAAVEAIHRNQMSANTATKEYKIPKVTLINKLHGKVLMERKMGPTATLEKEEEGRFENWITAEAKLGFLMDSDEFKDALQTNGY
ncbi:hypothetical protein ANN_19197 [Periplaneta americana]|uniref:HTH psq-type domain-containing protein n=1 Tax=Periplaneta americana TaxID=6978 RepID=A0ABQ8S9R2_PERAM|nr:hypothetical protein ANN_19197 [Periplaneta americana]